MFDKRVDIFKLLKEEGKLTKIYVYPAIEREDDPYEHTKTESFLNPIPMEALVQQISFEALKWKFFGQIPQDSIQLICESRYENLFKLADKIVINDKDYGVYKDGSKALMILKRQDYLVIILELKNA